MTTQEDFLALIQKYQDGSCSERELQLLENWYNVKANSNPDVILPTNYWQDSASRLQKILASEQNNKKMVSVIRWPQKLVLIAATIAIVGGIWTVLFSNHPALPLNYANDINPGRNEAFLTFKNGKKIQLSAAKTGVVIDASKLTYDDGTLINTEVPKEFTVSTPKGGTYQVRLPDGSRVWLNAASSLTYSTSLKDQQHYRNVSLSGEAYFEVSKDINRPFIVSTDQQKVQVLGTHFNISAYNDELSTKTTLLEGSIRVAPLSNSSDEIKGIILKPNQESLLVSDGIHVREVEANEAIAWKNGDFTFTNEPLESIMLKVARWYNVEVVYTDHSIGKKIFNGTISKFEKVSQVLCLLERTSEVQFKIEGRRITVMK